MVICPKLLCVNRQGRAIQYMVDLSRGSITGTPHRLSVGLHPYCQNSADSEIKMIGFTVIRIFIPVVNSKYYDKKHPQKLCLIFFIKYACSQRHYIYIKIIYLFHYTSLKTHILLSTLTCDTFSYRVKGGFKNEFIVSQLQFDGMSARNIAIPPIFLF